MILLKFQKYWFKIYFQILRDAKYIRIWWKKGNEKFKEYYISVKIN
jgi:hypothetical protein